MPLRSPSATINFLFNLTHLIHTVQPWIKRNYGIQLDMHSCCVGAIVVVSSLVVLFKQVRDADHRKAIRDALAPAMGIPAPPVATTADASKSAGKRKNKDAPSTASSGSAAPSPLSPAAIAAVAFLVRPTENLLLTLFQRLFLGWVAIYVHLWHRTVLDEFPWADAVILAVLTGLLAHISLVRFVGERFAFPAGWRVRFSRIWARWFFLLPEDPLEVLWMWSGYMLARLVCPETTGASRNATGGEICAYVSRTQDDPALRAQFDFSLLGLVFAGLIWPVVEFGRKFTIKCGALYASTPRLPTDVTEGKEDGSIALGDHGSDSDDDEDHSHSSGLDENSTSLLARTVAFSNMVALSMFITWVYGIANLAYASEYSIVHSTRESACPIPKEDSSYERDLALLSRDCNFQWSYLQNISMCTYVAAGVLAAIFGVISNPMPEQLRIQFFVTFSLSLWMGSVLPSCLLISTRCIV